MTEFKVGDKVRWKPGGTIDPLRIMEAGHVLGGVGDTKPGEVYTITEVHPYKTQPATLHLKGLKRTACASIFEKVEDLDLRPGRTIEARFDADSQWQPMTFVAFDPEGRAVCRHPNIDTHQAYGLIAYPHYRTREEVPYERVYAATAAEHRKIEALLKGETP